MNRIPLIDSVTHPTLDGSWLKPGQRDFTAERLLGEMEEHGVSAAVCVGMLGVGGYEPRRYAQALAPHKGRLIPVAFFDFERVSSEDDVDRYLRALKADSYRGIKIHPRFSRITLEHPLMRAVIVRAGALGLAPLLCTYFQDRGGDNSKNNMASLRRLLEATAGARTMLVHGGTVNVLEMMEIVRPYPELLLDLSLTLCKYEGSSVDLDLAYLFKNFDRRICVGSDYPEYDLGKFRARFEHFAKGLPREKAENIASKNIAAFLGLEADDAA